MHARARAATDAYNQARARVARFLHANSDQEVVFTYGTTYLLDQLVGSFLRRPRSPATRSCSRVLEHHSNLVPWQRLAERRGVVLRFLPMTPEGRLDLDRLESELTDRCRLVALTHCSNVTGALTDVARVVAAARAVGAKVMLDGAQRAPHGPLDLRKLDVDFYVFSGHKTYGPTGIGVLWGRRELLDAMPPFMTGGQMIEEVTLTNATFRPPPRRFEAGTPPIAAAIGLGAALDWMQALDWRAIQDHELRLTRRLLDGLASIAGVRVLGPLDTHDRRGVVSFTRRGLLRRGCLPLISIRAAWRCAAAIIAPSRSSARSASMARPAQAWRPTAWTADVDALLDGLEELVGIRASACFVARLTHAGKRGSELDSSRSWASRQLLPGQAWS